ncbi:hypothetical protein BsWGS_07209 [Bradybaena similaris]
MFCFTPQTGRRSVTTVPSESESPQCSQSEMARPQFALVPSSLAGPPMGWTTQDVKCWLEFCVKEFSLRPIAFDKFDLNGKALLLLTRTDFIERAPHAGDILYNVFQRLLQQEGPGYLRSPIFMPTPFISPGTEILPRPLPAPSARTVCIPIRPRPQTPICSSNHINNNNNNNNNNNATYPAPGNIILSVGEDNHFGPGVPASMLSPAPSEKCSSDADSANNESGHSPHGSDHEMDYDENMDFDPGRDLKYDISDQNDEGVCRLLWEFIYQLLQDDKWSELVSWESVDELTFRIQNPTNLADAWGKQKNRSNMTYEKLSRALRYYYKMNIIKKVQGKRLTYKFLQHPATIRKGQRGARPHSSKTLTSRESETEPTSTETVTPDSSTFISCCSISTPSSSTATTPPSHIYSGILASPKREFISDEPPELNTAQYEAKGNHFLRSCPEIKGTNQILSSFIVQDVTSPGPSETAQNTARSPSVSPGKHLLAMQKCQDKFCNANETSEQGNQDTECRSQLTLLNSSPEINRRHWMLSSTEAHKKPISNLWLIREPLRDDCQKFSSTEEKLNFSTFSERNISRQNSLQDTAQDRDMYFSPSASPLRLANSPRQMAPLLFTAKNHNDTVHGFLNSNDSFQHHHLNTYSRSFNHTSAHSSYTRDQFRPNQTSPERYRNPQPNPHTDHPAAIFSYPPDVSVHCAQDPFQIKHALKRESYDQDQEVPEDLSMKQIMEQDGLGKKVKSESDLLLVSKLKDVNRDSPQSCSADSAYGSDRAEFGKDASNDELHE